MKKTLALIMAFCLLLGTLAGCATSKKDNAPAQGNNGSVQKDNASDTSSDGEVTELLLWHMEEVDTRVQRIQSVVDASTRRIPTSTLPSVCSPGEMPIRRSLHP